MFKRFALALAFGFVGLLPIAVTASPTASQSAIVAQASLPALFDTEGAAQAHCPRDIVVWLNIPSGIYHYKGERWYNTSVRAIQVFGIPLRKPEAIIAS